MDLHNTVQRLYIEYGQPHVVKVTPVDSGAIIAGLDIELSVFRSDGKWFNFKEYETNPTGPLVWQSGVTATNVDFKRSLTEQKLAGETFLYSRSFNYPENTATDAVIAPTIIQFFLKETSTMGGIFAVEEVMWVSRTFNVDFYQVTPIESRELTIVSR